MHDVLGRKITCGNGLPAFVAAPKDASGKFPVIILLHERYGFTEPHFAGLARRFASQGYVCIAPDCFYKHPDQAALHRGDTTYEMTDDESVDYMDEALRALQEVPQADTKKASIMGVCQTGRHPLVYAARRPLSAALVWYGSAQPREFKISDRYPEALDDIIAKVECPVLGHFGELDHIISLDDVTRFRNSLEKSRKSFVVRIYRDAPHGWLNDEMPGRYRQAIADKALADQRAFLDDVLSPGFDRSRVVQKFESDMSAQYDFTKNKRQA
ncbi:MAG TPA: dienelactone hydrolase family protein [Alphaproteobacteria bacterium]|jgi:carboxymethylenebutenolidase